jgi:hypothetical protein
MKTIEDRVSFRRGDIHVLPIHDLREHEDTRTCWCQPTLRQESGAMMVIHQSADGRELIEKHGVM